jgi:hypothetical protein
MALALSVEGGFELRGVVKPLRGALFWRRRRRGGGMEEEEEEV